MEAKAIARHVRVTPRKARRMVNLIRGKQATEAITILKFAPQSAALPVLKTLESAIANARVKADKAGEPFRENDLVIKETYVDVGVSLKRLRARTDRGIPWANTLILPPYACRTKASISLARKEPAKDGSEDQSLWLSPGHH